jgi:outer membrane protein TolC
MSEESRLKYERQRKQLIFEVKKTFYEALNEKLSAEAMEKALQAKKERLRVLKELFAEGYVNKDEVLRQETDILFAELEVMKNRNREETSRTRLKNLVHHTGSDELSLKGDFFNGILTSSLQEIREAAADRREELRSGKARVRMAHEEVAVAKGGFFPQASLSGTFLQQKETSITRPQVWMLTATLDWSIFEWGRTLSNVRRAAAQKQREEYRLDEVAREVALEAEQSWRMVKEAEKAVAAHENNVRTFEYGLDRVLKNYAEGKVKLADLLETEAELIKANNRYLASINSLDTELARLEAATSSPIDTRTVPRPIHRPDFDAFSRQISSLVRKRKGHAAAPAAIKPADTEQTAKVPTQPLSAPATNKGSADAASPVAIQVGSYLSLKNAEETRKTVLKNARGNEVRIVPVGKFHKVRILGFRDSLEAENLAQQMGIRSYLIVRTANGP